MPGPVDESQGPKQNQGEYWDNPPDYGFDENYSPNQAQNKPKLYGTGSTGYTSPKYNAYGNQSGGGIPPTGEPGFPTGEDPIADKVSQLKAQGYTDSQVAQQLSQEFGIPVSEAEYYVYEHSHTNSQGYNKYYNAGGYGNHQTAGKYYQSFGNNYLEQYFQDQQMYNDAQDMARNAKKQGKEQMVKLHMILLLIMMGDITGALRAYTALMDRDFRAFSRQVLKKLGLVRRARARVVRNFAGHGPPRAYAGENPQSAARAQDRAQRYTQFVQLSTQAMGELQNAERELVDILQTMKRDLDNHWQAYASMRDNEFRTAERLMTVR